jgi:hypothetical protein
MLEVIAYLIEGLKKANWVDSDDQKSKNSEVETRDYQSTKWSLIDKLQNYHDYLEQKVQEQQRATRGSESALPPAGDAESSSQLSESSATRLLLDEQRASLLARAHKAPIPVGGLLQPQPPSQVADLSTATAKSGFGFGLGQKVLDLLTPRSPRSSKPWPMWAKMLAGAGFTLLCLLALSVFLVATHGTGALVLPFLAPGAPGVAAALSTVTFGLVSAAASIPAGAFIATAVTAMIACVLALGASLVAFKRAFDQWCHDSKEKTFATGASTSSGKNDQVTQERAPDQSPQGGLVVGNEQRPSVVSPVRAPAPPALGVSGQTQAPGAGVALVL